MTVAAPEALAATLDQYVADLAVVHARLNELRDGLTRGDGFAIDHAEEQLGWIADALRGTALSLDYLKRYTVTGAARIAATTKDRP